MATVIQIKRPTSGTSDTAPTSSNIQNAELFFKNLIKILSRNMTHIKRWSHFRF